MSGTKGKRFLQGSLGAVIGPDGSDGDDADHHHVACGMWKEEWNTERIG